MRGEKALFITLTYRRDDYQGPLDLYRTQSEEQHVPMFLRRLARALGVESLRGKWIRKMEFQDGGWPHFHLVLLWDKRIDWRIIESCWSHGFISVQRFTPQHTKYMSKYFGKAEQVPAYLLHEKPRSVKIVAASPSFWRDTKERKTARQAVDPATRLPAWVPLGDRIARGARTIIARDTERGHYHQVFADLGSLLVRFLRAGVGVTAGSSPGWVRVDCTLSQLLNMPATEHDTGPIMDLSHRPTPPRAARPAGLDLIRYQNPDWRPWGEALGPWFGELVAGPWPGEMAAALARTSSPV